MEQTPAVISTLEEFLKLTSCDEEGKFPDPRAIGFFENHEFKNLTPDECRVLGKSIALCMGSVDLRSFKSNGKDRQGNCKFTCSCSGHATRTGSKKGSSVAPVRNTTSIKEENDRCPAGFKVGPKTGFLNNNHAHTCKQRFEDEKDWKVNSLIFKQSTTAKVTQLNAKVADIAEQLLLLGTKRKVSYLLR